jgi:hypothetical protein
MMVGAVSFVPCPIGLRDTIHANGGACPGVLVTRRRSLISTRVFLL